MPITIQKKFKLTGVNDTTGIYQYVTRKGNLTYMPAYGEDEIAIVNTSPKYYGGFSNSFTYKNFQLDVLLQFTKKVDRSPLFIRSLPTGRPINQLVDVLNRWQQLGDAKAIQKYTQSFISPAYIPAIFAETSDYGYTNASFLRLKKYFNSLFTSATGNQ